MPPKPKKQAPKPKPTKKISRARRRQLYYEMLSLLNGMAYSVTFQFNDDKADHQKLVLDLKETARRFMMLSGCGNQCVDKVLGCVPCWMIVRGSGDDEKGK